MALNMDALREAQKELAERTSGLFFNQKNITEEFDIRIAPPQEEFNGLYYIETKQYWFGKKPVISRAILGENDIIAEEIEAALLEGDETLTEMIKGSDQFSVKNLFIFPFWKLKADSDEPTFVSFHLMQCTSQLINAITKIATSRQYQNKTEDGIFDLDKGFNLILSKQGQKLNTTYSATGYLTPQAVPAAARSMQVNLIEEVTRTIGSEAYQRSVVRNYLYGEPIVDEESTKGQKQENKPTKPTGRPTLPNTSSGTRTASDKPGSSKGGAKTSGTKTGRKSILDALDE